MIKTLTVMAALVASCTAFSTTASAAEVHISLVGKDSKTIQAEIKSAAKEVCRQELVEKTEWLMSYARCVDESVARAMAVLPSAAS